MVKRSKKYREAAERVDRNNLYTANEAIALLKSMPPTTSTRPSRLCSV